MLLFYNTVLPTYKVMLKKMNINVEVGAMFIWIPTIWNAFSKKAYQKVKKAYQMVMQST